MTSPYVGHVQMAPILKILWNSTLMNYRLITIRPDISVQSVPLACSQSAINEYGLTSDKI